MKKLKFIVSVLYILALLFSGADLSAQTIRYYSPQGNGTTGTSWATAWNSVDDIDFSELSGGGYLLFDGNAAGDSIVYNIAIVIDASGSWMNPIHIMPASYYYLGTQPDSVKGKVIIDHNYTGGNHGISIQGNTHWIEIKGLIIRHTGDSGIYIHADGTFAAPYRIKIDSCQIYEVNANECVEVLGYGQLWNATELALMDTTRYCHHIEISNNLMYTHANRSMPECNVIYAHLTGWLYIHHNTLWQRNMQEDQSGDTPHIDPIQLSYSHHSVRIYNNILVTDSCVSGHTMIVGFMSRGSNYADTSLVYNNFLVNGGSYNCASNWKQMVLWREPEPGDNPGGVQYLPRTYVVNNTWVAKNQLTWGSCAEGRYNPYLSNNILVHLGQNGAQPGGYQNAQWYLTGASGDLSYVDSMHTNLMWQKWNGSASFGGSLWRWGSTTGSISGWSDWVSKGGDGVNADPLFVRPYFQGDFDAYEIESNSPAIDAGTNMSYLLQKFEYMPQFDAHKDLLGNQRDANWDIGCFEYTTGGWSPPDTIPSFSFTALTGREKNTEYIASSIFYCDYPDSTFHVWTTTGAEFKIGTLGTYSTAMKTAVSGDYVYVKNITGDIYNHTFTETIVAGGYARNFNVTTKMDPGGGGVINGGWLNSGGNKKVYDTNGKAIIMRTP